MAAFTVVTSTGRGGHVGSPWQDKDQSGISQSSVIQQRGGKHNGEPGHRERGSVFELPVTMAASVQRDSWSPHSVTGRFI